MSTALEVPNCSFIS